MSRFQGQRLKNCVLSDIPTAHLDDLPPGGYWKVMDKLDPTKPLSADMFDANPTNLTGEVWMVVTPNQLMGNLSAHTVREHEDGTISVRPGDGSSNSILVGHGEETYHGYIEHGVWSEC